MASDDNKTEKGSSEMETPMSVEERETKLSNDLKELITNVDTHMVSLAKSIDQLHEKVMNNTQDVVKAIPSPNPDNELGVKEFVAKTHDENMSQQVKSVSVDTESANSIDQFHQDVENAIPITNSGNEMDVQEIVAKTPEHTSQLVKSVKYIKTMQTNMIQSLSKLLHFLYVDSEEICTNKLPDKCELQIDSYFLHGKDASEAEDVWIKMLQEENKRLRERNKLYREHAALVNTREKLVSEERDRIRKELNVFYQNVGSHVGSDDMVCVHNYFNGNVTEGVHGANHKEISTDNLSSEDSDKKGVHGTNHRETCTDNLSFDGNVKKGVHGTEQTETRTDNLFFDDRGDEGVHGTEHKKKSTDELSSDGGVQKGVHGTDHKLTSTDDLSSNGGSQKGVLGTDNKETSTDDLSSDGSVKKGVHGTYHKETSTVDLSSDGNVKKGVHGTDHKDTSSDDLVYDTNVVKNGAQGTDHKAESTDDLSSVDNDKQGIHDEHYKETNIDDVEKDRIIQEMQKSLNDAQQKNGQLTALLQSKRQLLEEKEELLRTVNVRSRYEVDVVYARIAKEYKQEECLVGLLTQKYIDCNVVKNFTTTDDVTRAALILCIGATTNEWDTVLRTSKRKFPENRPVAVVMMYSTSNLCKQTCEDAQKKHVEFLSDAKVFSIRYISSHRKPLFWFFDNEENPIVEFIRGHSVLKTKVVGCPACKKLL